VFHGFPGRARFEAGDVRALRALCRRTARAVVAEVEGDPVVWLHEPALAPAARELRRLRPDLRLVLSCHVPFPSEDVLRTLPWAPELLEDLLSCDALDFATDADARRFLDAARWILGAEACPEWRRVTHGGRVTRVLAVGAGVDAERLEALAAGAAPARPGGPRRLLAIDPLDATRGIPRRLTAFERLLERYPEWIGRVVLEQIVLPEPWGLPHDAELARQVHEHVGQVNGRFGTPDASPVQYWSGPLDAGEWAALARDADVGLVTPLREGTATAAHAFVACRVEAPGALVLSSLSGHAETLREAVRVNPYDTEAVARAIHRALCMGPAERRARMARLRRREREHDVQAWTRRVLAELADPTALRARP
jgi:trehalose 6-phosphate synthase/phosphatase